MKKNIIIIILFIFSLNILQAQDKIKKIVLDDNNITTELWNYGSISTPGALPDVRDFVWNGLGYMYEFGTMISAEVVGSDGDTLHITSDSFVRPSEGDYDAAGILKWGWLPDNNFYNPLSDEIANSHNPNSWPLDWSEWHGEYGNGKIIGNNEVYYVMNDYTNYEFIDKYFPIDTNVTIGGLGVSSAVRIYQFGGGLKDALIVKYFITNNSDKNLPKVYFGFQCDPHMGGARAYGGDIVKIVNSVPDDLKVKGNLVRNTIYLTDQDIIGQGGKIIRNLSFKFLETPDNLGLTSFHAPAWGAFNPKDDEKMWEFFSSGIDTVNYLYNTPGDNVINFSTGPFTLDPTETKIVKLVIFFSYDYNDILEDATYISLHHNWPLIGNKINEKGGSENYRIQLNNIPNVINGDYEITWSYNGSATDTKVFLEYSNNKGKDWYPLFVNLNTNEGYIWNTGEVDDGVNYILRIIAYKETNPKEFYYAISSSKFTINNPNFNAKPELELITTFEDTTINSSPLGIEWISEDADNNELNISIQYSFDKEGPFYEINNNLYSNGNNRFYWDLEQLPNAQNYFIRIIASDENKDSVLLSNPFSVEIFEKTLTPAHVKQYRGNATPIIQIQTLDQSLLKNNEYSILFNVEENNKTFDIKNITTNKQLITNYPLNENISTPLIEGMKITVKDFENDINYNKTRFVSTNSNLIEYTIEFPAVSGDQKVKVDDDYLIIFNDTDTLIDGTWAFPDTMETLLGTVLAPFSIWNIRDETQNFSLKEPATFVLFEPEPSKQGNGQWDWGESIILQPQGTTVPTTSYQITINKKNNTLPQSGDSLFIITYNQIEDNDEFRFSPDSNFVVEVKKEILSKDFSLTNNYPNPFNPTTVIQYSIPKQKLVTLKIYDVLGKEIAVLVNEQKLPGVYKVEFNATALSSGIYFYRLKAGKFTKTKKMVLVK